MRPTTWLTMTGDPRAFKQIVLNLVSNAIKFTERGGKVTVSAVSEGSRLALRVSDTGVGIAADDLKRIGHPFFQAGKTYQRRHEGTGLGLSIVKSLVALHAGEITVQSKLDEGNHCYGDVAPGLHATGAGTIGQDRDAHAGAAFGKTGSNTSGEEKCLDALSTKTTHRLAAAVAAPRR